MTIAKARSRSRSKKMTLGDPAGYPNRKSAREVNSADKPETLTEDEAGAGENTKFYRYEMSEENK
jgi:hypothetical protein